MPRSSRLPRRRSGFDPRSALLQLLGEHHDDAAGAADVGELVDVAVSGHAAERVAAVPRGDLESLVDVVDGEGDAVHADLVGPGGLRLDRVGMDVLEELEATVAVWRLEHDGHALHVTESRRPVQGRELRVWAQWSGDPLRRISVTPVGHRTPRCTAVRSGLTWCRKPIPWRASSSSPAPVINVLRGTPVLSMGITVRGERL